MKRVLSLLMALMIIIASLFSVSASAFAEDKNDGKGMYKVTEKVYADAYMLINLDDDDHPVIAQKHKDKKKYPASLTKIATAMVVLNKVRDLQETATVSQGAIDLLANTGAQVAGLKPGDTLTVEQLLYLIMVYSACDACTVVAEHVAGTVPEFVKLMNNWAKSVGCTNTNFVNCDGLHDDNHYTTASDMALMTLEAMENETFMKIACTKSIEYNGNTYIHTNFMLDKYHVTYYYEYAEGIKTGSTSQAGYCVITKASKDGYTYLAIVMDSPIEKLDGIDTKCSFIDAATLFDWAFDSLKYATVIKGNDVVSEIPVLSGKDADTVQLISKQDVQALVPVALDPSAVMIQPVNPPSQLEAPIVKGDKICEADIIYGGKVVASVDLVAGKDIELSTFLKISNGIKAFLGQKIVLAVLLLLILFLICYIVIFALKLSNAKKKAQAKRRRRQEQDEKENLEYQKRRGRDDYLPPPKRRK